MICNPLLTATRTRTKETMLSLCKSARAEEKIAFRTFTNDFLKRNRSTQRIHKTGRRRRPRPSSPLPSPRRQLHQPVARHTLLEGEALLDFLVANRLENTFVPQAHLPRAPTRTRSKTQMRVSLQPRAVYTRCARCAHGVHAVSRRRRFITQAKEAAAVAKPSYFFR